MNSIIEEETSLNDSVNPSMSQIQPHKVMTNAQMQQMDNALLHDEETGGTKGGLDMRILVLGAMNFLINAATSIIVPLFPYEMVQKDVGELYQSLIFAVLPIGSVAAALYAGKHMLKIGRKKLMILGLILSFLSLFSYSIITLIPNKQVFLIVCIIMRIFQGVGRAMYSTVVFAFVPILWPDAIQKHIGILESLTGLGIVIGPIIAGALSVLGKALSDDQGLNLKFRLPFWILSSCFAIWIVPILRIVPPDIQYENLDLAQQKAPIPLGKLLAHRNIGMTCFASMMSCAGGTFFNAIMQTYMIQCMFNGVALPIIPFIFGILAFSYLLILLILPKFQRYLIYKFTLSLGLLINTFGCFLLTPIFGEPDKWWTVSKGFVLLGISQGMAILPQIPEIQMLILLNKFADDDVKASDMASGVFFASYSAGILVGPLTQGIITTVLQGIWGEVGSEQTSAWQMYNMRWVSYIMSIIIFVSFLLYGIVGQAFSKGWSPQLRICKGELLDIHSAMKEQQAVNQFIQMREQIRKQIKADRANTISERSASIRALSTSQFYNKPNNLLDGNINDRLVN